MPDLPSHTIEPGTVLPAAHPQTPAADTTPPAQRLRCPHCHNPIQLADGHSDEVLCPACGTAFQTGESRPTVSTAAMRPLGKFQLLERVGVGGFGAVWKARDTTLDRVVALKIPHAGLLTAADELERFQREARAAGQLRHPGIVPVHEVVMLEGLPVIVSDFVTGVPLKDLRETRRLTPRESATLLAAAADAIHYAHSMGVIHRDLKPANIIVPYGPDPAGVPGRQAPQLDRPLLMDFGLALRCEAEATMTQEGQVLGTPAYMSPEQATGHSHQADARSDVWALGVVLYELLTGELPFRGSKIMMLMQIMNDEPKPPCRLDRAVPRDLETVCLKCLQKEPARRYASAADLAADLRRFLNGEPVLARPVGKAERLWRWCRRNPALAGLQAAVVLLLAAGTAASTYFALQADQRADDAVTSAELARERETEAQAREKEAVEAREQVQVALARNWLGAVGHTDNLRNWLGVRGRTGMVPLADPEIAALWQIAENRGQGQWFRFMEEALREPGTARQLNNRAELALHAVIGLDPGRRAAVERLLLERLRDPTLGDDQRTDVAGVAVALDDLTPEAVATAAAVLAAAMSKPADAEALSSSARDLSVVAERMEPREAAVVLTAAMGQTTDALALSWLAEGLAAVTAHMEPQEAAQASAVAATILAAAMSKTTSEGSLGTLAGGLRAVAPRLEPKEAAAVAHVLAAAMGQTTVGSSLRNLAGSLSVVAPRMERREAAAVANIVANIVTGTMSKTTDGFALPALAGSLSAVAPRLEPREAARFRAASAAVLTRALSKPTDGTNAFQSLAYELSAVAAGMEPNEAATVLARAMSKTTEPHALLPLAERLSKVAARLEPGEATRVSAVAAARFAEVMSKTTDGSALSTLASGLAAVTAHMEPQEAARASGAAAALLAAVLRKTTDASARSYLAGGLLAVGARMEPGAAAALLVEAMDKPNNAYAQQSLAYGLFVVAARMEPQEAAALLATALGKMTNAGALQYLALGVAAVAARMGPREAARVSTEAAAILVTAMGKPRDDPSDLSALAQGVAAVTPALEPKEARRVSTEAAAVLVAAMRKPTTASTLHSLARGLAGVTPGLEPKEAVRLSGEAAALLTAAMSRPANAGDSLTGYYAAEGLSALAMRLESHEAREAAAVLVAAVGKTRGGPGNETQALSAVLNGCEPTEVARRATAVTSALGVLAGAGCPVASPALLGPAAEPLPCRLSTQELVDLLKQPTCLGPARRVVLDYLGARYQRSFRTHWEFVEYARQQLPDVDLTTPPQRPRR